MIKKGNQVEIICGKDKGKKGEVIEILRQKNKAKVKGVNIVKKHEKVTKEKKGGIISKENSIHISNLKNLETKVKDKKIVDKKWYQGLKTNTIKKLQNIYKKNFLWKTN